MARIPTDPKEEGREDDASERSEGEEDEDGDDDEEDGGDDGDENDEESEGEVDSDNEDEEEENDMDDVEEEREEGSELVEQVEEQQEEQEEQEEQEQEEQEVEEQEVEEPESEQQELELDEWIADNIGKLWELFDVKFTEEEKILEEFISNTIGKIFAPELKDAGNAGKDEFIKWVIETSVSTKPEAQGTISQETLNKKNIYMPALIKFFRGMHAKYGDVHTLFTIQDDLLAFHKKNMYIKKITKNFGRYITKIFEIFFKLDKNQGQENNQPEQVLQDVIVFIQEMQDFFYQDAARPKYDHTSFFEFIDKVHAKYVKAKYNKPVNFENAQELARNYVLDIKSTPPTPSINNTPQVSGTPEATPNTGNTAGENPEPVPTSQPAEPSDEAPQSPQQSQQSSNAAEGTTQGDTQEVQASTEMATQPPENSFGILDRMLRFFSRILDSIRAAATNAAIYVKEAVGSFTKRITNKKEKTPEIESNAETENANEEAAQGPSSGIEMV